MKPAVLARLHDSIFDEIASMYEEDYFERHYGGYPDYGFYPLKAEKIINLAGNPKSVLDVGSAYGRVVKCLREKGVEAVGLDISRYAGQKSKQVCGGWYVRGVAWMLPFKEGAFDACVSEGTLEHVPEDLIPQTFEEFERVSSIRVLAISFCEGEDKEGYHLCNHDFEWWWQRIPANTWLFTGEGTQNPAPFKFKGENGETKTSTGLHNDCKLQKRQYMRYYRWLKKEGGIHKPTHLETYLEPEQIRRLHWIKWHARLDTESNPPLSQFLDPQEIHKVWNKHPETQQDIIEIGCSNGVIIKMLNGKYGMDKEPEIIAENRRRNPKIEWVLHDATKPWTMFPDSSVSIVAVLDVLEHVPFRKALFVLKEAIRVAKHKVLITIPNGLSAGKNARNVCCFKHLWILDAYRLSKIQKQIKNLEHALLYDPAFICIEVKKKLINSKHFRLYDD